MKRGQTSTEYMIIVAVVIVIAIVVSAILGNILHGQPRIMELRSQYWLGRNKFISLKPNLNIKR